jgi:hypothetical protein
VAILMSASATCAVEHAPQVSALCAQRGLSADTTSFKAIRSTYLLNECEHWFIESDSIQLAYPNTLTRGKPSYIVLSPQIPVDTQVVTIRETIESHDDYTPHVAVALGGDSHTKHTLPNLRRVILCRYCVLAVFCVLSVCVFACVCVFIWTLWW